MPTPTFQLLIRATGETRLIYAEHERSLFDAIRQRTGLDEAIARGILARGAIKHPEMEVKKA